MSLRQWEEVQEMLRSQLLIIVLAAGALTAPAAVLPEQFGAYKATAPAGTVATPPPSWWQEYSYETSESRAYAGNGRQFTIEASRFADPTGAAAAFDAARPEAGKHSRVAELSSVYPGGELLVFGNYLLKVSGYQPEAEELVPLAKVLPKVNRASLPLIRGYLPEKNKVRNSERYIMGPDSLAQFAPQIPPAAASFDMSSEAAAARYKIGGAEQTLVVFTFPTQQIARSRFPAFEQIAGAKAKRSGPLVAIVPQVTQEAAATKLLNQIEYQAEFMWAQAVRAPRKENIGQMILSIMTLAGILIVAAGTMGILFGSYRVFGKKFGMGTADGGFTALDLREK